jgi:putative endonuclease
MRQNNQETGKAGEDIAAQYLIDKGFIIIERNWRHRHLEVDLIAHKDQILHFIEVKTRTSLRFGYPEESISKAKMQFLKFASAAYQYQHPSWKYIQFDALSILLRGQKAIEIFMIADIYY